MHGWYTLEGSDVQQSNCLIRHIINSLMQFGFVQSALAWPCVQQPKRTSVLLHEMEMR